VELSALRIDFSRSNSNLRVHFFSHDLHKQKLKLAIKMLTRGNPVTIKRATKRKTDVFNIPITKDDVVKEVRFSFSFKSEEPPREKRGIKETKREIKASDERLSPEHKRLRMNVRTMPYNVRKIIILTLLCLCLHRPHHFSLRDENKR